MFPIDSTVALLLERHGGDDRQVSCFPPARAELSSCPINPDTSDRCHHIQPKIEDRSLTSCKANDHDDHRLYSSSPLLIQ